MKISKSGKGRKMIFNLAEYIKSYPVEKLVTIDSKQEYDHMCIKQNFGFMKLVVFK